MRRSGLVQLSAAAAVAAIALTACSSGGSSELDPNADISEQTLTISTWPEYYSPTLAEDFEAATGVKLNIVHHATNEEGFAKVTASADSGIDIVFLAGNFISVLVEEGLASEIDQNAVPNLENLYPEVRKFAFDPDLKHNVPYAWGTTGLCYREDLVAETPDSWADLLEPAPEAVGKTTLMDDMRWTFIPAQRLLGYSINTTDEAELDEVGAVLKNAAQKSLAFDNTTYGEKLIAGEAVLSHGHDGWCNTAASEDPRVSFAMPKEGSDLWVDGMVLLKSSKNREAAHAFMNYILETENQTWLVENLLYNVPNRAAMESLPDELFEKYPALIRDGASLAQMEQIEDVGDAIDIYNRINTEIRAG